LADRVNGGEFTAEFEDVQRKVAGLVAENAMLQENRFSLLAENADLEKKIASLEVRVEELEQECARLRNPRLAADPLNEDEQKFLFLFVDPATELAWNYVARKLDKGLAWVDLFADSLQKKGYLTIGRKDPGYVRFGLTVKGKEYLQAKGFFK
jgi:cell division protein FtsB